MAIEQDAVLLDSGETEGSRSEYSSGHSRTAGQLPRGGLRIVLSGTTAISDIALEATDMQGRDRAAAREPGVILINPRPGTIAVAASSARLNASGLPPPMAAGGARQDSRSDLIQSCQVETFR